MKSKRLLSIIIGCFLLLAVLVYLRKSVPPEEPELSPKKSAAPAASQPPTTSSETGAIFRGHYGYILKVPSNYKVQASFANPQKTQEMIYLYPKGTDPTHFIHEGLYGHFGIVRLEVTPRRVPQGLIGVDTLRAWVKSRLDADKATYTLRPQLVHGLSGFIVNETEPFPSVKAYLIGQKVYYVLSAGREDALFTDLLSSLLEAAPLEESGN